MTGGNRQQWIQYIVTGMSCAACSSKSRKSSFESAGGNILLGKSAYQLYGSRRHGNVNRRSLRQSQMPDMERQKKEKERQRHSRHQHLPEKIC